MKLAIITALPPSKVTLTEYGYHLVKSFRSQEEVEELILLTDEVPEESILEASAGECKVTVKPCWSFNSYKNVWSVQKAISQTRPDAILFNLQFLKFGDKKVPAALGLLLPALCRLRGIPTIVLLHNILEQVDLDNAGFTGNKWLQKLYGCIGTILTRTVLCADVVAVTISKYVDILNKKYKTGNIALIPHGSFEVPPKPSYELPKGALKIMAFGKFGTYKKVEVLIEAVELVRTRIQTDLEIVIAGTDSPNTPGYLHAVHEKYAHVSNLTFTGYVEEEDVPRLFNESAVVVFPYTSTTGSSGVLHQAGSYGKAVVLPDIGDLSILIREEGYAGEFFAPGDASSLADALEAIITDNLRRMLLGQVNYAAACSLPMDKITAMYLDQFKNILEKSNNAPQLIPDSF